MTVSRRHTSFLLIALGLLLCNVNTHAQETSKTTAESSQQPSIVLLNVRVTDEAGRPVSDVRQEDIRVLEDGVPQTISFFSKEEVPLSYGLLIDNSGSMRSQLDQVLDAGRLIVNGNKPGDETFLVRFVSSDSIQMVSGFTSSKAMLFGGLDSLYIEGGQTAVIDAVLLAIEYAAKNRKGMDGNRRVALVLVTDGEDRGSRSKRSDLIERLHREDIQIFTIGLVKQIEDKKSRDKATELLKFLAQETGGRAFFPNSTSELRGIAEEITRDLRTQYLVGYIPAGANAGNTFHKVQVTVAAAQGKEKRVGVTRVGYIAAPRTNK
jgi:Ca-activated chloride channel family protein